MNTQLTPAQAGAQPAFAERLLHRASRFGADSARWARERPLAVMGIAMIAGVILAQPRRAAGSRP